MSIPNFGQIIGSAVQGALADTQAWLARQGQALPSGPPPGPPQAAPPQAPPLPMPPGAFAPGGAIGQTFSNLGTAVHNAGLAYNALPGTIGQAIQNAPQFDPSQTMHGQADTGQNPLALIGQRLAQEAQSERQGVTTLPHFGQVNYSNLPGPLNALAHVGGALDNAAGLDTELIGNVMRGAVGGINAANAAGYQHIGQYSPLTDQALRPQRLAQTQAVLDAFGQSGPIAAEQAQQRTDEANHNPLDAEGLAGALSMVLPGKQIALPAELAADAPRLAAAINAANTVSRASLAPFDYAPILHLPTATGVAPLVQALRAGDAGAAAINAGTRLPGTAATADMGERFAALADARAATPGQRPLATIDGDTQRALDTYLNAQAPAPAGGALTRFMAGPQSGDLAAQASAKAELGQLLAERQAWIDHGAQTPVAPPAAPAAPVAAPSLLARLGALAGSQRQIPPNVDNSAGLLSANDQAAQALGAGLSPEMYDPARLQALALDPQAIRPADQQATGFPANRTDLGGTQVALPDLDRFLADGQGEVRPGPMSLNAGLAPTLAAAVRANPTLARAIGGAGAGAFALGAGEEQKRQLPDGSWVDFAGHPTTPPDVLGAGLTGALIGGTGAAALGGGTANVVGNALKSFQSSFGDATQHLLDVNSAPGQAAPSGGNPFRQSLARSTEAFLPGNGNPIQNATAAFRQEHKTWLGVPIRNYIGNMVNAAAAGGLSPTEYMRTVSDMQYRQPAYLAAVEKAQGIADPVQREAALDAAHLDFLPDAGQQLRQQFGDAKTLAIVKSLGESFQRQDIPAGDIKAFPGAARGLALGSLGPAGMVAHAANVAVPGLGLPYYALAAARGALLPWRVRMQTNLLGPIDQGGRLGVAFKALHGALADGATIDQAGDAASTAAIRAFGDYNTPGLWERFGLNTVFPGSSWNVGQTGIMGHVLQDHPELLPAAVIAAQHGLYPQVNRAEPGKTMTLQVGTNAPVVGPLVKALNGGADGNYNINPTYPFLPFGGDALNLADQLTHQDLYPDQQPFQDVIDALDAGGLTLHPGIAAILQHAGWIKGGISDPDKLSKFGQAGDIALNNYLDSAFPSDAAHPLPASIANLKMGLGHLPSAQGVPDKGAVLAGRANDPAVDTAANELAFEQTGKPLADLSNRVLLEQTKDPNSPLMRQAKARAGQQLLGAALAGNASPGPADLTTDTKSQQAFAESSLRAAGVSRDQIAYMEQATGEPLASMQGTMVATLMQAKIDAARIYAADTPQARGELLLKWFHHDHNSYAFANPAGEQYQEALQSERLGLTPQGTANKQVAAYFQGAAGLTPGGGGFIPPNLAALLNPGLLPTNPAQNLPGLLNPAATPYLLPPGAGRP